MKRIVILVISLGTLFGALALSAGAASAGVRPPEPQPVTYVQPGCEPVPYAPVYQRDCQPRPEPVRFCTERQLDTLAYLLRLQREGRHLTYWQRIELRQLEEQCFVPFEFPGPVGYPVY